MSTNLERKYDITVFGATGNAGSAVAYWAIKQGKDNKLALAGRNKEKIDKLKAEILQKLNSNIIVDTIICDSENPDSLLSMTKQSKIVIACAGPYNRYGEPVINACIKGGAHYCDITGETPWVDRMKNKYEKEAQEANVSIISFCGYDCVPAELAMYSAWNSSEKELNSKLESLELVWNARSGGFPKGTLNTILDKIDSKRGTCSLTNKTKEKQARIEGLENMTPKHFEKNASKAMSPFSIFLPYYSSQIGQFTGFNFMAGINVPVVYRALDTFGCEEPVAFYDRLSIGSDFVEENQKPSKLKKLLTLFGLIPTLFYTFFLAMSVILLLFNPVRSFIRRKLENYNYYGDINGRVTMFGRGRTKNKDTIDLRISFPGDGGIYGTGILAATTALTVLETLRRKLPLQKGFCSPVVALRKSNIYTSKLIENGIDVMVKINGKSESERLKQE